MWAIENGYLVDLRGIQVSTSITLDGIHTRLGDFAEDELERRVNQPERNEIVVAAYQKHALGRQAICFGVTVQHAQDLASAFRAAGVRAQAVSGEMAGHLRRQTLADYDRGACQFLCNVGVLTEGYDHPATSCIILARPTKSRPLYVQCLDAQTEILTAEGWKGSDAVQVGDLVAGFDTKTGFIRWVPAQDKVVRPLFDGEQMYED